MGFFFVAQVGLAFLVPEVVSSKGLVKEEGVSVGSGPFNQGNQRVSRESRIKSLSMRLTVGSYLEFSYSGVFPFDLLIFSFKL